MKSPTRHILITAAFTVAPALAHAHTGAGGTSGLVHGFMHPIGGLDHMLAMIAVGMFAFLLGGRALWLVPASFVLMMAFGGLMGMEGTALPFVEAGIAASLVVLGLAVALRWKAPVAVAMTVVGLFAVFHGYAHGAEMPLDRSGLAYALGFMAATALLHIAGIGLGAASGRIRSVSAMRLGGGTIALIGVAMLGGAI
ncbi:HupE/UreJ family protein [Phyllobacterium leguminum]|uniref:Urease accessory protein n=1 Tax=Phyllobacterium leguminum TaxID=314237 RepID=A0A318T9D6_9HYPH|nr:HupE/UreJ family protein [Phyllobacterium leguminum]PYE87321.1 urease accessory protein [Phyllobacterium leguminum]